MRSKPQENCPLCGHGGRSVHRDLHDRLFGAAGQWHLSQCQNDQCGLLWMNPMPLAEDLHLAYETYYTHDTSRESAIRKFGLFCYRTINLCAGALTGLSRYQKAMQSLYLAEMQPGRLLDVGCGDGRFLYEMKSRGWQVKGVEVDPQAVTVAREKYQLDVQLGGVENANFTDCSFDAVTLRHVIEHLPDPVGTLKECKRILRPGGRLVVVTPNTKSWGHSLFGRHWLGLDQPRHLMIFSPSSLTLCARQAGFDQFRITTSPANAETFFSVSYSLVDRETHEMDLSRPPKIGRALKAVFYQHWESLKLRDHPEIGEELVLWGCKK